MMCKRKHRTNACNHELDAMHSSECNINIETCRVCGGTMKVLACIEDPVVIKKILTHLIRRKLCRAECYCPIVGATRQPVRLTSLPAAGQHACLLYLCLLTTGCYRAALAVTSGSAKT